MKQVEICYRKSVYPNNFLPYPVVPASKHQINSHWQNLIKNKNLKKV